MAEEEEKRAFTRFENKFDADQNTPLLLVTVPALADGPIEPEDFSAGGFRLKLAKPPEVGIEVDCTVKVFNITLSGLRGIVAWVSEPRHFPPSCFAGLAIQISEGERDVLSSLMTAILTGSHPGD